MREYTICQKSRSNTICFKIKSYYDEIGLYHPERLAIRVDQLDNIHLKQSHFLFFVAPSTQVNLVDIKTKKIFYTNKFYRNHNSIKQQIIFAMENQLVKCMDVISQNPLFVLSFIMALNKTNKQGLVTILHPTSGHVTWSRNKSFEMDHKRNMHIITMFGCVFETEITESSPMMYMAKVQIVLGSIVVIQKFWRKCVKNRRLKRVRHAEDNYETIPENRQWEVVDIASCKQFVDDYISYFPTYQQTICKKNIQILHGCLNTTL